LLVVGPADHGRIRFAIAGFRTQLFNPVDIDNVRKIQAGYRAMPLSKFLNKPAPPAAPEIAWPKIDKKLADSDLCLSETKFAVVMMQSAQDRQAENAASRLDNARYRRIFVHALHHPASCRSQPQEDDGYDGGLYARRAR
jgi:hypothetical protein